MSEGRSRLGRQIRWAYLACVRGLVQAVLSVTVGVPLLVASVLSIASLALGIGVLLVPVSLLAVRRLANQQRRLALDWSGVEIPARYRPPPDEDTAGPGRWRLSKSLLTDPATWRDLLWTVVNLPVGLVLGLLPVCLLGYGLGGVLVAPWIWVLAGSRGPLWLLSVPLGALVLLIGAAAGPRLLKGHALFARSVLAPSRQELAARVGRLTESRADAVGASAAELRRIERDLHDGAQAQLVSLGMHIGLAEQLVRADPDLALTLLAEARQSSGQALSDLRDLVRGIHPPVLAERGLDGAVRAVALSLALPVDVHIELAGRAPAPVESAAYFAIAEALANVVKHSAASRAWVRLRHEHGTLVAIVGDDGVGGANPASGSGLRGIERRLAAFDATIAVTSPSGGPTVVTMELPCELSSAKISPS